MAIGASEAARQAHQTEARIKTQLYLRVVVWVLLGWAAFTVYIIWRQTGEFYPRLHHAYF